MCEKQKFFLDMFYRVNEPLLMKEYETYAEKLVHEKDMFTVSFNIVLLVLIKTLLKFLSEIR